MRQPLGILAILLVTSLGASSFTGLGGLRGQGGTGLNAQGTSRIQGVVRASGGKELPGVDVRLTSATLGHERHAKTNASGAFRFTGLSAGSYQITATLAGFASATIAVTLEEQTQRPVALVMIPIAAKADAGVTLPPPAASPREFDAFAMTRRNWPMPSPIFQPNTESYDRITESRWTDAARSPLSTFSIDVDTASYANVRRFLNSGTRPPTDAVRIEELINYFSYDYPEPRDGEPFSITTALGESPWHPGYRLALVGLQARHIPSDRLPPRNLVFLIDVSGSMMTPNKLPLVKSSLTMLAQNLTARDHVAIVVYAGAAGLVLPSTRGDDRSTIIDALARLEAGGSTNGADGLRLAYRTAKRHFAANGVNRVILATDGDFNVGVTSRDDLLRLVEIERESGTGLSVLGYGFGNLKDGTMEQLADKGDGNYAYIDDLSEARKVLVEEAGGTLVTVAKDVKLQVEFNPAVVSSYRLIGYENRALADRDFNDDRKDAGELGAGHSVTALYEIVPMGQSLEDSPIDPLRYEPVAPTPIRTRTHDETMWVKVRYKRPEADTSTLVTAPLGTTVAATPSLGFASAVASFGMLLRNSEHKGRATFAATRRLAQMYRGADSLGHRAEFARLVALAESLTPR